MDHLIIKSITPIRPMSINVEGQKRIEAVGKSWIGKYATRSNIKLICRDYKKAAGWRKYRSQFSEFYFPHGSLYIRISEF